MGIPSNHNKPARAIVASVFQLNNGRRHDEFPKAAFASAAARGNDISAVEVDQAAAHAPDDKAPASMPVPSANLDLAPSVRILSELVAPQSNPPSTVLIRTSDKVRGTTGKKCCYSGEIVGRSQPASGSARHYTSMKLSIGLHRSNRRHRNLVAVPLLSTERTAIQKSAMSTTSPTLRPRTKAI
jgi:hypothetical protein